MAIHAFALKTISKLLSRLPERSITCFSYPDILAKPEIVAKIFDIPVAELENYRRNDSREILNWHKNAKNILTYIIDTKELFQRLGFIFRCSDLGPFRNKELFINLNKPFTNIEFSAILYDSVLHHCCNICNAYEIMLNCICKEGFYVGLHPLNSFNSCYHNISPVWLFDVLTKNGFEVESQEIFRLNSDLEPTNRLKLETPHAKFSLRGEYLLYTVAKRTTARTPIDFDIIHPKFVKNPTSKL